MDVLKSIWSKIKQVFSKTASIQQEPSALEVVEPLQNADYRLLEFEEEDAVLQENVKEATGGRVAAIPLAPKPRLRVVPPPPSVEPPKAPLRLLKPRIQPLLEEALAYGRSRTNLLEEAFKTQLMASDLETAPRYLSKIQDFTFHTRWVATDNPIAASERYKSVSLVEQWAALQRQGIADEVIWRFNPSLGRVPLSKLDPYREQSGWMELLEVTVHMQPSSPPSKHAFLIAYTDAGEVLGHPFMNSIALLPAEMRPITLSGWVQPSMEAEKAQWVDAYLKTRFWDEWMADLDSWRQRTHEKLRVGLNQAKRQKLLYSPEELTRRKEQCHNVFLKETEAIDSLHEWLLAQMEDFSSLRYHYETLIALRWELV